MSMARQERRRRERQAKKEGTTKTYEMSITMLQPWSTPVMKTILPPNILQTMIEISDIEASNIFTVNEAIAFIEKKMET